MLQNSLSRVWFLSQGCKQVPPDFIGGKILWAHPDGYFLSAQGQKLAHGFSPSNQRGHTGAQLSAGGFYGSCYPKMSNFSNKTCHFLMALAFYGSRPTYINPRNGKEYVGVCHHLINDKLDYRPANLLCWLTKEQHLEADLRQRELRKVLHDMHNISYVWHRRIQDPRVTSFEDFRRIIHSIQVNGIDLSKSVNDYGNPA